ncbi:choice-of-anchor D domain-containing protein [Luteolibacter marinus]|uniref:choice-of-anchor D domain-containing protein n=1 Tax=Luteolibacter marinus TaxID=2776705 RepID=UPI001867013E|nr:choice-of-anchor D domain-containing protein [Luteolibacter marinus]
MKSLRVLALAAAAPVLLALRSGADTILIDYSDGGSDGEHDVAVNDGDFSLQGPSGTGAVAAPWVLITNSQFLSSNASGVGSAMNFASMGGSTAENARRIGIDASGSSGYTLAVGNTLNASFMARPASGWAANDSMGLTLFYTEDDTLTGAATTLASFVFTGRSDGTWSTETFPPVVVSDAGAVGKKLFASIQTATPGTTATGNYCRIDNLFVSVNTATLSPFMVVEPEFTFSNTGSTTNYGIPVSNAPGDGTTALNISGVAASGDAAGDVSNIVFPSTLAAGSADNITFDFTPSAGAGTYTFDLEITSDDAFESPSRVIPVEVTVLPSPDLEAVASISFINDGTSQGYSVTLTNNGADGTTALNIDDVTAYGFDATYVSNLAYPSSVASGESGDITFDFLPSDGAGIYTFDLEVSSNDESDFSPWVIEVTIDVRDPVIAAAASSIQFGNFTVNPGPQTATLTITNTGGGSDLVIDQLLTAITGDTAFTVTSFPGPIAPGASGDIEVTFDPGAVEGLHSATLAIVSNDYQDSTPQIALTAFVVPQGNVAAADFGSADSGVAADYTRFVVGEGAVQSLAGVTLQMVSKNGDIATFSGLASGDLLGDGAATTFNGGAGNYISILLTGLAAGELNLVTSHDYDSGYGLPQNIMFGEQGATLDTVAANFNRPGQFAHTATVESGKTYELRMLENGNANLAYISSLILWGDAVPGGTAFGSFVSGAGLDPATTGLPDLDPDQDGVATGIEWVIGGSPNDPANPDSAKLPGGDLVTADPDGDATASSYLRFTYRRSDLAAADANTAIGVEYGNGLAGWTTAADGVDGVVVVETNDGFETGIDRVEVYIPAALAADGKLFARLAVTVGNP